MHLPLLHAPSHSGPVRRPCPPACRCNNYRIKTSFGRSGGLRSAWQVPGQVLDRRVGQGGVRICGSGQHNGLIALPCAITTTTDVQLSGKKLDLTNGELHPAYVCCGKSLSFKVRLFS